MTARVEHLVTSGTFSLDGQTFDVDNNVWIIGDDEEVIVVDAPHDADAIAEAVGDRTVVAIACTHAHDDHVRFAPELGERLSAQVLLHPEDRVLWDLTHARHEPDGTLREGQVLEVAGTRLHVLHTPGHAPGHVALYSQNGFVISGDALFKNTVGRTDIPGADHELLIRQIKSELYTLPHETVVLPGHGSDTTIGAEIVSNPHTR